MRVLELLCISAIALSFSSCSKFGPSKKKLSAVVVDDPSTDITIEEPPADVVVDTNDSAINGGWSAVSTENNNTDHKVYEIKLCNNPLPQNGGLSCTVETSIGYTNVIGSSPKKEKRVLKVNGTPVCVSGYIYYTLSQSCVIPTHGAWSATTSGNQFEFKKRTPYLEEQSCNNPLPSNGGNTCTASAGGWATFIRNGITVQRHCINGASNPHIEINANGQEIVCDLPTGRQLNGLCKPGYFSDSPNNPAVACNNQCAGSFADRSRSNFWYSGPSISKSDDLFFAFGGFAQNQSCTGLESGALSTSEAFDASLGQWITKKSMPEARTSHNSIMLDNGKILITGGSTTNAGQSTCNTSLLYDPNSDTYTEGPQMQAPRGSHSAVKLDSGKILLVGSMRSECPSLTMNSELYDPTTNTFSGLVNMPAGSEMYHSAVKLQNGKVVAFGGFINSETNSTVAVIYDPSNNSWSSIPNTLYHHAENANTVALSNGNLFVSGGYSTAHSSCGVFAGSISCSEEYNPTSNTWTTKAQMNAQRYRHSSVVLPNGDILVCGGDNGGYGGNNATYLSSCEIYNYDSNTWTAVASMSVPRQGNFLVNLPSGIVAAIGNTYNPNPSTNLVQTSIEFFNPLTKTWSQTLSEAIASSSTNGNNALCTNGQLMIDGRCEAPCAAGTENILGSEGTGAIDFSSETLKTNYNFWRIRAELDGTGSDWIKANTTTAMGGPASQGDDPFIEIRWDGMCRTGQGWYNNGPYHVVWSDWTACGSQFSAVSLSSSRNYFSYKIYSCY